MVSNGPSKPNNIPVSLKSFCLSKPVLNTMAFEGLDASNNRAEDDAREIIRATSNFKEGRTAMQMGTIKVVAVELVITLANIIAKKPKIKSNTMLFKCMVMRISA